MNTRTQFQKTNYLKQKLKKKAWSTFFLFGAMLLLANTTFGQANIYTLTAIDEFGDGWNNAEVQITTITDGTITYALETDGPSNGAGPESITFTVLPGEQAMFCETEAGFFANEVTYSVTDPSGAVILAVQGTGFGSLTPSEFIGNNTCFTITGINVCPGNECLDCDPVTGDCLVCPTGYVIDPTDLTSCIILAPCPVTTVIFSNVSCLDLNQTPCDPNDDTIFFDLEMLNSAGGSSTISTSDGSFSTIFPNNTLIENYPLLTSFAGNGDITFIIVDNANPSCTTTAVLVDPGTCSIDTQAPFCNIMQAITVALDATGTVTITAADLDVGSGDNCGILTTEVSPSTFDCDDLGANIVTMTITDINGNITTCESTVTVEVSSTQPGFYFDISTCSEVICPPGTSCPGNTTEPIPCPAGSFQDAEGQIECISCPAGTAQSATGQTDCLTCLDGTFSNTTGATECTDCVLNNDCLGCDLVSGDCTECPPGFELDPNDPNSCMPSCNITAVIFSNVTCIDVLNTPCNSNDDLIFFDIEMQNPAGGSSTITSLDGTINYTFSNNILIQNIPAGNTAIGNYFAGGGDITFNVVDSADPTCTATAVLVDPGSCSIDDQAPVCTASDITVTLDATNTATITAADISGGSTDNCGILSTEVSPSTFGCSDVGDNTVTLTITDINGNVSTCDATVTVEVSTTAQPGFYFDTSTCSEVICPPGTSCPGNTTEPIPCPAGSFQDAEGQTECISCPAGTAQSATGQTACFTCLDGTFSDTTGATECTDCVLNNDCIACDQVSGDCTECPAGFELDPNDPNSCIEIITTPPTINCPTDLVLSYTGLNAQDAAIQAWLDLATAFTSSNQVVIVTNNYDANSFSECQGYGTQTVTFTTATGETCTAILEVTYTEPTCATEGFESLNTGDIVSTQLPGLTIYGASNDNPGNLAMIFDSANPTGGDFDLASAVQGKVLIISEDGDGNDPDDEAHGGIITFTFDNPQYVGEMGFLDIESLGSYAKLYNSNNTLIQQFDLPVTGDGGEADLLINLEDVKKIEINLMTSGAVTGLCTYDQDLIPSCESIGCKTTPDCASEDFEIFQLGDIVSNQIAGTTVYGFSNNYPNNNAAMIFDSENPTGGDSDLATANDGFVIILSEDGDSNDPDDAVAGGILEFTFDNPQFIDHITLLDIEGNNSSVKLFAAGGGLIKEISIPSMGNGNQADLDISTDDVSVMEVHLHTSGAIIDYCTYESTSLVDCPPVTCGVQVLSSDFENGYGVWTDGGSDSYLSTAGSPWVMQNKGVRLRDNSGSSNIRSQEYDLSSYESLTLDFTYMTKSVENGEDFFFEISTDGGSSYTVVETWVRGTDFSNNTRYFENLDIAGPFSDEVKFRFRADFGVNNDKVFLDDILIHGCTTGGPIPALRQVPQEAAEVTESDLPSDEQVLDDITLFPVPASTSLTVQGMDNTAYHIYSIHGTLITEGIYTAPIELTQFATGTYILRAIDGRAARFIKL